MSEGQLQAASPDKGGGSTSEASSPSPSPGKPCPGASPGGGDADASLEGEGAEGADGAGGGGGGGDGGESGAGLLDALGVGEAIPAPEDAEALNAAAAWAHLEELFAEVCNL